MTKTLGLSVAYFLAVCVNAFAQKNQKIIIETQNAAMVFSVKYDGKLYQSYFGV